MPYSKNAELPENVKVLPSAAQTIFRKAFNEAEKQYEEERSFNVAWAAVKKAGYKKEGDEWVKESEDLTEMYVGWGITSFEQLEAQKQAVEKAFEIQDLTSSYKQMIDNIMLMEDEDKVGEINRLTAEFTSRLTQLQEAEQRKKIEQNEENMVELEENAKSVVTEIEESENGPLHAVVRIIRPGWGNKRDNHYYPQDVLKRDSFKFIGAKMFETDHKQHEKST